MILSSSHLIFSCSFSQTRAVEDKNVHICFVMVGNESITPMLKIVNKKKKQQKKKQQKQNQKPDKTVIYFPSSKEIKVPVKIDSILLNQRAF